MLDPIAPTGDPHDFTQPDFIIESARQKARAEGTMKKRLPLKEFVEQHSDEDGVYINSRGKPNTHMRRASVRVRGGSTARIRLALDCRRDGGAPTSLDRCFGISPSWSA